MKALILTDNHWGIKRSSKVFENHILRLHKKALDYCKENDIKIIFHLGDFFDVRKDVSYITLDTVKKEFLDPAKEMGIQFYMVAGNHDCPNRNNIESNAVSIVFKEYENIRVFNFPSLLELEDGSSCVFCPWIAKDDEKDFLKRIDKLSSKADIILGHFEFKGFLYQKGIVAEHGMEAQTFTPKFQTIISGHYHSKSSKDGVHYLGTQYDLTWADYDEKKYFHVLDTKTGDLEAIENPDRMYHKLFYNEHRIDNGVIEELKTSTEFTSKIIKVVVEERTNMVKFDMFMDALYSLNPHDVTIVDERMAQQASEATVDVTTLSTDTLSTINKYIDEAGLSGYSTATLNKIMSELYQEAQV
ncbi:MAG TPA: metallophosphoesterase [Coprothermobacter proteolyticus]|nr:metallophosphoesterase [Coprothermobacter proteolyticus]